MMRPFIALATALLVGPPSVAEAQDILESGPVIPFEDDGECPFEGCVYRQWTVNKTVEVRTERRRDGPVAFTLHASEKVTALAGVVITLKAGRVQFREPTTMSTSSGPVRVDPGETLYLLTYQGEGFTKAWIRGRLYRDLDTTEFFNGVCDAQPSRCAGKIVEKSQTEWWVQVRNGLGGTGWTNEPDKFDGKDALGAP
jgi:hypothetical protein